MRYARNSCGACADKLFDIGRIRHLKRKLLLQQNDIKFAAENRYYLNKANINAIKNVVDDVLGIDFISYNC